MPSSVTQHLLAVDAVQTAQPRSVQQPVNVESRSASGIRPLARSPPSSDGVSARKSITPSRTSVVRNDSASSSCSVPMPAAVGLVPLRFIGASSTKPPSSRRRDSTNRPTSAGEGKERFSSS
jgi:hypothetical protein